MDSTSLSVTCPECGAVFMSPPHLLLDSPETPPDPDNDQGKGDVEGDKKKAIEGAPQNKAITASQNKGKRK